MSIQAMNWVIEHSQHKGSNFVTLLMIANHANAEGENSFPSMKTLAKECRTSMRSIQRCIDRLEASGELKAHRSLGRTSHTYSLPMMRSNVDRMSTLAEPQRRQSVQVKKEQRGHSGKRNVDKSARNVDICDANVDIAMSTDPLEPSEPSSKTEPKDQQRSRATYGVRLTNDFQPSEEVIAWAKVNAPNVDLNAAREEFIDYWVSIPGKAGLKLDWQATFRNRLRQLQARAPKNQRSNHNSKVDHSLDAVQRVIAQKEAQRNVGR